MIEIAQLVLIGIIVGSIIGLGAMGLTLVYGVFKFANFAHADLMTLGMYLAFFVYVDLGLSVGHIGPFSFGWGMIAAVLFAWAGVAAVSVGADRFVFRRLRARQTGLLNLEIAALGIAIALQAVVQAIWGSAPLRYHNEINEAWSFAGGLRLKADQLLIVVLLPALAVALYLLLHRTRLGTAMRATADNAPLAEASGIDTERVRLATWVIAAALTAVAGVMFALQSQLRFDAGFEFLLLPMFAAVILGGIGNPWGALVGGLIVGISQELSTEWINTGFKPAVPFVLLIAMLIVRPRGLFGSSIGGAG